ncbi:hypothetical protein ACA910_004360 [Epithemia clementina (nom. ined.)]
MICKPWTRYLISLVLITSKWEGTAAFGPSRYSFGMQSVNFQKRQSRRQAGGTVDDLKSEAEELLRRAREIRSSLPLPEKARNESGDGVEIQSKVPEFRVPSSPPPGYGYRLYLDLGREDGTWMDPRWGASGKRIQFTLDVHFASPPQSLKAINKGPFVVPASPARNTNTTSNAPWVPTPEALSRMIKDNFGGKSFPIYRLISAPFARLRQGFDRMKTTGEGAYRLDQARNGGLTVRFLVDVEGTLDGQGHSDIFVPKGCLYFSLPCFGDTSMFSAKEGPVTVRQIGWHTGWRREESRIVGTFRAVPLDKAVRSDSF